MTDDLEARLRAAVHAEAASAAASVAARQDADSLTAIRSRLRTARRRRHALVLVGAAALVVAAGAVPRLGQDDDQSVSTEGRPDSETTTTEAPTTTAPPTSSTTAAGVVTPPPPETSTTTITSDAATSLPVETPTTAPSDDDGASAVPGCVGGWTTPTPGTARRVAPLDAIRRELRVTGQFRVLEMRYFTGPEVPWIESPGLETIEWWYVKARLVDDPAFQARWLVVRRAPGVDTEAIAAVAPFDTTGYRSPDWRAFLGDGRPHAVEGLPGRWAGVAYDFVRGEDGEKPGLPDENARCLDGT